MVWNSSKRKPWEINIAPSTSTTTTLEDSSAYSYYLEDTACVEPSEDILDVDDGEQLWQNLL